MRRITIFLLKRSSMLDWQILINLWSRGNNFSCALFVWKKTCQVFRLHCLQKFVKWIFFLIIYARFNNQLPTTRESVAKKCSDRLQSFLPKERTSTIFMKYFYDPKHKISFCSMMIEEIILISFYWHVAFPLCFLLSGS